MTPALAFTAAAVAATLCVAALLAWPLRRGAPRAFVAVLALVPLLAFGLYQLVGTPGALQPAQIDAPLSLEEAVARLEADLERDPRQVEGWRLLGRAYAQRDDNEGARDAFARAAALDPENDDLQVEYAEARARANAGRRFDAEAVAMLRAVLARTPAHQRARWFLGIAQRQAGDDAGAAATWTPLLAQVDGTTAASLRVQINAARAEAGLPPLPSGAVPTPARTGQGLAVRVSLDPGLAERVPLAGDATVFVIARIPGGGPMPVAVERHALRDLPLQVVLDDGDGPMPTQRLSALAEVEVVVRVSASGDASRQPGDIETAPLRVALPASQPVAVVVGETP